MYFSRSYIFLRIGFLILAVNRNIKVPSLRFQERCIRVFMARYIYEAHELLNWYLGLPLVSYISIQAIFKAFYCNDNKIVGICQTMTSEHLFLATFVFIHLHDVQIAFTKLVVFISPLPDHVQRLVNIYNTFSIKNFKIITNYNTYGYT